MIQVTLMLDKKRAIGAEMPQVPTKGDEVLFDSLRYQVTKVIWVIDARSDATASCSDVFVSMRSLGV